MMSRCKCLIFGHMMNEAEIVAEGHEYGGYKCTVCGIEALWLKPSHGRAEDVEDPYEMDGHKVIDIRGGFGVYADGPHDAVRKQGIILRATGRHPEYVRPSYSPAKYRNA